MSSLSPDSLLAHHQWVRGLARSLVLDDQEADDVVQEAWLAALRSPPTQQSSLRAWLAQVVRNAARQLARGESRRAQRERAVARPEAVPATTDLIARAEAQKLVVDAVLGLREPYLTTVLLRFYESLPPREVARRLGVPVETVRARLRRAMEQLRGVLDREQGGRGAWGIALLPLAAGPPPMVPPVGAESGFVDGLVDLLEPVRKRVTQAAVPTAIVLTTAIGAGFGMWSLVRPDRRAEPRSPVVVAASPDPRAAAEPTVEQRIAAARSTNTKLERELAQMREEIASLRVRIAGTRAPGADPSEPDPAPRGLARISVPGEEQALAIVDWDRIGNQVRIFLDSQRSILTDIAAGEQWSAEALGRRSSANGALVEVEVGLRAHYGEAQIPNEHLTRPSILGNLLLVTLEAYGVPADELQRAAITRFTVERTRELTRWERRHASGVSPLRELHAMTRLRRRFVDEVFAVLTAEQLAAVRTSAKQERVGAEIFSDGLVLHSTGHGVAGRGREWVREHVIERMTTDGAELPAAAVALVDAWLADLPDADLAYKPVELDEHGILPAALLRTWLAHTIELMDRLEAIPELVPYAERLGSELEIPLPVAARRER